MFFEWFAFGSFTGFGPVGFALPFLVCIYAFCVVAGLDSCPPGFFLLPFLFIVLLFA
jgi:hypothetical protein